MKILLMVIAGVALLGFSVVATGSLLPKGHVASRSASFNSTSEHLFSLIAGSQSWRQDVLCYEALPNNDGRQLVRETTRNGESITYELLDRMPPTSIKRKIATDNLPYSGSWTFSLQPQGGGGTLVRITENGQVSNPVFRFMSRFVFGHTRTIDNYLRELGKATAQEVEPKD
jgi:hypothetical protein